MKRINNSIFCGIIFILFIFNCCSGPKPDIEIMNLDIKKATDIPDSTWKNLETKSIYFGHQSVGYNIVDGLTKILEENKSVSLNVVEIEDNDQKESPAFYHFSNGINKDPKSKIQSFKKFITNRKDTLDFAFYKFCYVDIHSNTDINEVFDFYVKSMDALHKEHPDIKLIHFTCPVRVIETGPKAFLKKILKKNIGVQDNIARGEFNKLLLDYYGDKQFVFDLAKWESTRLDGSRVYSIINDKPVYYLNHDFTTDGGHLNEAGSMFVAEQLLVYLAQIL